MLDVDFGSDGPSLYDGSTSINPLVFSNAVVVKDHNGAPVTPFKSIYVDGNGDGFAARRHRAMDRRNPRWRHADGFSYVNGVDDTDGTFLVFTLNVDAGGSYQLAMHAPLWHPLSDDPSTLDNPSTDPTENLETEFEDNLTLEFNFTATDGDGDQTSAKLTVNVDDDTPDIFLSPAVSASLSVLNLDEFDELARRRSQPRSGHPRGRHQFRHSRSRIRDRTRIPI